MTKDTKQKQAYLIGGVRDGEFAPISGRTINVPILRSQPFSLADDAVDDGSKIEVDAYHLHRYRHPATGQSAKFYVLDRMSPEDVIKRLNTLFPSGLPEGAA